jgi:hypothetical protein
VCGVQSPLRALPLLCDAAHADAVRVLRRLRCVQNSCACATLLTRDCRRHFARPSIVLMLETTEVRLCARAWC